MGCLSSKPQVVSPETNSKTTAVVPAAAPGAAAEAPAEKSGDCAAELRRARPRPRPSHGRAQDCEQTKAETGGFRWAAGPERGDLNTG